MLVVGGPFSVTIDDHHRTMKILETYIGWGEFGVGQAIAIDPLLPFKMENASNEPGASEVVAASFLTCTTIAEVCECKRIVKCEDTIVSDCNCHY